jgi:hypothetical protein
MAAGTVPGSGGSGQEQFRDAESIVVRGLSGLDSLAEILIECPHVADLSGGTCVAELLDVLVKDARERLTRDIDNALTADSRA